MYLSFYNPVIILSGSKNLFLIIEIKQNLNIERHLMTPSGE